MSNLFSKKRKLSSLIQFKFKKLARITGSLLVISQIVQAQDDFRSLFRNIRSSFKYSIHIQENDRLYIPIYKWLFQEAIKQNVKLKNVRFVLDVQDSPFTSSQRFFELIEYLSSNSPVALKIDSAKIYLTIDESTNPKNIASHIEPRTLKISTYSRSAHNKLKALIKEAAEELSSTDKISSIYVPSKWDGWERLRFNNRRAIDYITLPANIKELLLKDLKDFISSEEIYNSFNIPYHRGYLFYGPPGTGKTSTITALAAHFQMNVYTLDLTAIRSANDLNDKVYSIDPYSILILEDVDILSALTSREQNKDGLSLNTILQILDGLHTPHGLITFMTTNDVSKLDEALLRKGRVDLSICLDFLTDEQLQRLIHTYYPNYKFEFISLNDKKVAPSEISEIFKSNFHDPKAFFVQLLDLISSK